MPVLEDLRLELVALHEQTALVIGREVKWTDHAIPLALAQPRLGGIEQRPRHLGVTFALEEAEQAPAVVLKLA